MFNEKLGGDEFKDIKIPNQTLHNLKNNSRYLIKIKYPFLFVK